MKQSELRSILLETSLRANYSQPVLRKQADEIDIGQLAVQIRLARKHMDILEHAFECMQDGIYKHPMQAFLHATECEDVNYEGKVSDAEFFALLKAWGIMCEHASRGRIDSSLFGFTRDE